MLKVAEIRQTMTAYVLVEIPDKGVDPYDVVSNSVVDGRIDYSEFELTDTDIVIRDPKIYEFTLTLVKGVQDEISDDEEDVKSVR